MFKKTKYRPLGRNAFCWVYFCFNNNRKVDCNNFQMMHYILCYNCHVNAYNPKTLARKGFILYYKKNGIIVFNKHVKPFDC